MRFISKYGRLLVQVRAEVTEAYANGIVRTIVEPLGAQFEPGLLRPHEREAALAYFQFSGLPQELDEATTIQPDYRIGVYDSERVTLGDEERRLIEEALIKAIETGTSPHIMLAPASSVP